MKHTKVKLSLCFFFKLSTTPLRHIGEWRYSSTHSLTSALDVVKWSASHPGRFTPRERALGKHWIGGWVCPRAILDMVKRKIPSPFQELNPRAPNMKHISNFYQFFNCSLYKKELWYTMKMSLRPTTPIWTTFWYCEHLREFEEE
jgi:hypothetical protein